MMKVKKFPKKVGLETEVIGVGGNPMALEAANRKIAESTDHAEVADKHYESAIKKIEKGEYDEAIEEIKEAQKEITKIKFLIWYIH